MEDLEKLYRRHASAVLRFAWGLCGDRSRAEDIVSETFERILTRAPRIETQTALAYLMAVARNLFLTGQNRRRREVPLPEGMPAPESDPADRLADQARLEIVLRALRNLPEGERAGEASPDSRSIVETYLAGDDAFASTLRESDRLQTAVPRLRLSPDAERRLLDDARGRARMKLLIMGGAIGLVGFVAVVALGGALLLALRGF